MKTVYSCVAAVSVFLAGNSFSQSCAVNAGRQAFEIGDVRAYGDLRIRLNAMEGGAGTEYDPYLVIDIKAPGINERHNITEDEPLKKTMCGQDVAITYTGYLGKTAVISVSVF